MAFQISKVTARVSVSVIARVLEKQQLSRGVKFTVFHPAVNTPPCARGGINIATRSECKRVSVSRGVFSRSVAVLLGVAGVSAAALSSSAVCAMAAHTPINLDSDKSDWKEAKSEFLCCD